MSERTVFTVMPFSERTLKAGSLESALLVERLDGNACAPT